ncbi:MAG: peptidylprolyl isomerase [Polyangiaceae bacterium]
MNAWTLGVLSSLVALPAGLACGSQEAPRSTSVALHGEAARVGEVAIPKSLVAEVARARRQDVRRALDDLIEDSLLASEASARGLDREPAVRWASIAAAARHVPERLSDDARAVAPTDDELASVRVMHAVVRRSKTVPSARAYATAESIHRAVALAHDDDTFERLANQVPHPGLDVTVERLPEFDATGRIPSGELVDATFVTAALELHAPGQLSEVIETPFGWHVIRLIERVAPTRESVQRLRSDVAGEVRDLRVRSQVNAGLREARRRFPVEISAAAGELMAEAAAAFP